MVLAMRLARLSRSRTNHCSVRLFTRGTTAYANAAGTRSSGTMKRSESRNASFPEEPAPRNPPCTPLFPAQPPWPLGREELPHLRRGRPRAGEARQAQRLHRQAQRALVLVELGRL